MKIWNGLALKAAVQAGSVSKSGYPVVWLASILSVTLLASGNVGSHRLTVSFRLTLCSSTYSMSNVAT